jgi:hypothetical protein
LKLILKPGCILTGCKIRVDVEEVVGVPFITVAATEAVKRGKRRIERDPKKVSPVDFSLYVFLLRRTGADRFAYILLAPFFPRGTTAQLCRHYPLGGDNYQH